MMRPVSLALPPIKPDGLASSITGSRRNRRVTLTWNDNSITETSFVVQRTTNGTTWTDVGTLPSPLAVANTHGTRTLTDATSSPTTPYLYRVAALNTVGYGAEFPSMTVKSVSADLGVNLPPLPAAPTSLGATLQPGPRITLTWRDNATTEFGFLVERSANNGATFAPVATAPARNGTGNVTLVDTTAAPAATYQYRVTAVNLTGTSAPSNTATVVVPALAGQPTIASSSATRFAGNERVTVTWADVAGETGYTVQWSTTSAFTTVAGSSGAVANATTLTTGNINRRAWFFRVGAANPAGTTWSVAVPVAAP